MNYQLLFLYLLLAQCSPVTTPYPPPRLRGRRRKKAARH